MMPPGEVSSSEFKPLEVQKTRVSGPIVTVIGSPAVWELKITVTNNLEPSPVEDEPQDESEQPLTYYSTRGQSYSDRSMRLINPSTITDVIVKDTFPCEFVVIKFRPTQGNVIMDRCEDRETHLTWNVGALEPKAQAILELTVGIANRRFSKPGNYLLNGGATATGILHSKQEILSDGPTEPLFVTVTDGTPNEVPVAEAGIDELVFEGDPAYLDGSGSYDPDGFIVKYTWCLGEERIGSSRTAMTYLPVGVHVITLIVEDNRRATDTDEVIVTVYEKDARVSGGVVTGVVRDATTYVGFDPYIVVSNENYAISTWTDFEGDYRIIGLPDGHYEVFCQSEGYQDFYGEVNIRSSGEVHYDIAMFRE